MHWADKIAKEIIVSGKFKPYWVDDMKTPSGRIHVGSLRGTVIHDLVYKAILDCGVGAKFTWVFDNHDPMDGLPVYLEKEKWAKYLGMPLFQIPSPDGKAENYAGYFADEFISVFNKIGCQPEVLWASDFYLSGGMNEDIRLCLNKTEAVRGIYENVYKKKMPADWHPFQIVCPKCGKESTTRVTAWDGEKVSFECKVDAVDWTKGCGKKGKASPFSQKGYFAGKLPWKIEWAVKWKLIGVTVEGAGKDHMTAGGSHDIAAQVCQRVLNYPVPYPIAYEHFLIGGKKMSSSKGLGASAREMSEILPPYLLRFLFVKTDYKQAIDFDPKGNLAIPDLFDEYDRAWKAHDKGGDEKLARTYVLAQIDKIPEKEKGFFTPRFRDIANYLSQGFSIDEIVGKLNEIKKGKIDDSEMGVIEERVKYAKVWLGNYAPEEYRFEMTEKVPEKVSQLTDGQKKYLKEIIKIYDDDETAESLQISLYELSKQLKINPKDAFAAIYLSFIGRAHGPRAGMLLSKFGKEKVIKRIKEVVTHKVKISEAEKTVGSESRMCFISPGVKSTFPGVSFAYVVIKGTNIKKIDPQLEKLKDRILSSKKGLVAEDINKIQSVCSYREMIRKTGVDYHSRRPSPDALLRRIVLGKGLYTINTAVDSYNLAVVETGISLGGFDYSKIAEPVSLRFSKEGEEVFLLGDEEKSLTKDGELVYADKDKILTIDLNYRDIDETKITMDTKDIILFADGGPEIDFGEVKKALELGTGYIIKFCGGKAGEINLVT